MKLNKKSKQIYAKIEALENAASMIGSHLEVGSSPVDEEIEQEYAVAIKKLAKQLNGRANKIRKKYGLEENGFTYK